MQQTLWLSTQVCPGTSGSGDVSTSGDTLVIHWLGTGHLFYEGITCRPLTVHISNVHFDTFQHALAYQIITMTKIMSDQNSNQHYWKFPHFLLQPSLSIPNQASMILALQSVHFLYFTQPEVLLTRILSSCVITEPFTHAARIHTFFSCWLRPS